MEGGRILGSGCWSKMAGKGEAWRPIWAELEAAPIKPTILSGEGAKRSLFLPLER